ncbi:MAG: NADH-quinone oxidoreductase subunit H, partial [Fuerstiella sp.]
EYSGMRWSYFFMGEYASMFAVCGVASILFLGGWHTGLPGVDGFLQSLRTSGAATDSFSATGYLANVIGAGVFATKASLLVFVQIWIRWTLPRLRIDQVMITCLKYLLPISCFLFLGAVIWPLALLLGTGTTTVLEPIGARVAVGIPAATEVVPDAPKELESPAAVEEHAENSVTKPAEEAEVEPLAVGMNTVGINTVEVRQ